LNGHKHHFEWIYALKALKNDKKRFVLEKKQFNVHFHLLITKILKFVFLPAKFDVSISQKINKTI